MMSGSTMLVIAMVEIIVIMCGGMILTRGSRYDGDATAEAESDLGYGVLGDRYRCSRRFGRGASQRAATSR